MEYMRDYIMIVDYIANETSKYTFDNGQEAILSTDNIEELSSSSILYKELKNKKEEIKNTLSITKEKVIILKNELYANKEDTDIRVNEAQRVISALRLAMAELPDGIKILDELSKNDYNQRKEE